MTTLGRLKTPDQFADIVIRAKADGSIVRVRDIGTGGARARATTTWPAGSTAGRGAACCSISAPAPTRWPPSRRS